jgi:hypothetical protein
LVRPAPCARWQGSFPRGKFAVIGRAKVHGLRQCGRNHTANCDIGCLRPAAIRNRFKTMARVMGWLSEIPAEVSTAGGNAVTE